MENALVGCSSLKNLFSFIFKILMNVQMDNITVHTDASISYPKMENSLVLVQRDTNSEQTNDLVKMSMNVSGKYWCHLVVVNAPFFAG